MAVTKGHGNPDWTRDEVLLALELYQGLNGKIPGPSDERVVNLSTLLRSLPLHPPSSKNPKFRNPDGVAFKLQNIRQIATGQGLGNVSAMDKAVWADFGSRPDTVRDLANHIRAQGVDPEVTPDEVSALPDDEEFVEGRVITTLHKVRERHPGLRRQLIKLRKLRGPLRCDACRDGPKCHSADLWEAGFEGHHVLPLAQATSGATKLKDMALLCATCHRLIHRAMHLERRWISIDEFSRLLAPRHAPAASDSADASRPGLPVEEKGP
jgi:5-methylcytosine-specific restriction enzyme A